MFLLFTFTLAMSIVNVNRTVGIVKEYFLKFVTGNVDYLSY